MMLDNNIRIHDSSIVASMAKIGSGTTIWQYCNIMDGAVIGENCSIGQNVFIESGVVIGNNVKIKNNVALFTGIVCEDNVFIGPSCVFTNVINPRAFIDKKSEFKTTVIKQGATIGANATVVCGHVIEMYAMIGAGSVVTKDVLKYELIVGNPGRKMGYVCQCGERLEGRKHFKCNRCKKEYRLIDDKMEIYGEL